MQRRQSSPATARATATAKAAATARYTGLQWPFERARLLRPFGGRLGGGPENEKYRGSTGVNSEMARPITMNLSEIDRSIRPKKLEVG